MQTILGSSGTIGRGLARCLTTYANDVCLVSRNPETVNDDAMLKKANLLSKEQTRKALEGSKIAYLTVGVPYRTKLWKEHWPRIMANVISACSIHKCKLVFFDNVYAYGKVSGWMTEQSNLKPCSQKGVVRATIAHMLMDAVEKGDIDALIARSADFYGPDTAASFLNAFVIENMIKGKKAKLLMDASVKHTWAYTPDQTSALALLGNTPDAYNQIWHLPVDMNALSGKEIVKLCADNLGLEVSPGYIILAKRLLQIAGVFNHEARETKEMLYQFSDDYLFDCTKFDKAFAFEKTSYSQGILASIEDYLNRVQ